MSSKTACPCDAPQVRLPNIAAGLPTLPRQLQTFPHVRRALLGEIVSQPALSGWRARGERDFGVMWLEMWAYVSDVLGFYDERIANETYLRTAVRRPSLRRIVDLLGYLPAPGVGGSVVVAAIADGRTSVPVLARTAFRSDAFGDNAPQVFETEMSETIHPLTNSWELGPVPMRSGAEDETDTLIFETANFGLAKDRFVLVDHTADHTDAVSFKQQVAKVQSVEPFEGKDGKTYVRVKLDTPVRFSTQDDFGTIVVQTPTVVGVPTRGSLVVPFPAEDVVILDAVYRQLRNGDPVIVAVGEGTHRDLIRVNQVSERLITAIEGEGDNPDVQVPVTEAVFDELESRFTDTPAALSFHFLFVDAGRLTRVAETTPTADMLRSEDGVPVANLVDTPPAAINGVLTRDYLLRDADNQGALVHGEMRFSSDGTARFRVTDGELPARLKTPITVFGNLLRASRGESVFNEVLGNGDARVPHQVFQLKKKPLTYLFDESADTMAAKSTLKVAVDGVLWQEVNTFFGRGPEDHVYIVRHDDEGNTFVTFGDGVRGARAPSGVRNIIANYRFGSGQAAPPANAVRQLARAVKGLRRVESPIPALIGKDPNPPDRLRTAAPEALLTFGRAVSAADFEAFANLLPGVIKAVAEFLWIASEQQAGVIVTYISESDETREEEDRRILEALRGEAEPGLPLFVRRAKPWAAHLKLELEVHPRFNSDTVADAVKAALLDEQTGPLARRNAPIGQYLFRSVIFDVVHEVPGVVSIVTAEVWRKGPSDGYGFLIDLKSTTARGRRGICTAAGAFADFVDLGSVMVTGELATAPVVNGGLLP